VCKTLQLLSKYFLNKFITSNRAEATFNSFESSHTTSRGNKTDTDWQSDIKLWVYYKNQSKNQAIMDNINNISNLIENIVHKKTNRKKVGIKAISTLKIPICF